MLPCHHGKGKSTPSQPYLLPKLNQIVFVPTVRKSTWTLHIYCIIANLTTEPCICLQSHIFKRRATDQAAVFEEMGEREHLFPSHSCKVMFLSKHVGFNFSYFKCPQHGKFDKVILEGNNFFPMTTMKRPHI